ncbi:hypothetical protein AKO1_006892, partial [Acrasis kona]
MFSQSESEMSASLYHVCEKYVDKSVWLAKQFLQQGKKSFKVFTNKLQHQNLYSYNTNKCHACVVQERQLQMLEVAQNVIESSLVFARRLYTTVLEDVQVKPITEGDEGISLFEQCFAPLEDGIAVEANENVFTRKESAYEDLRACVNTKISEKGFSDLKDYVEEMLNECRKQEITINASHNHRRRVQSSPPTVKTPRSEKVGRSPERKV